MEANEALKVLIQAVNVAQKRGAYNLNEASVIATAAAAFVTQPNSTEEVEETQEESSSDTSDDQTSE